MIPLWYSALAGLWMFFAACMSIVLAFIALKVGLRLFVSHGIPALRRLDKRFQDASHRAYLWIHVRRFRFVCASVALIVVPGFLLGLWFFYTDDSDTPDVMQMVRYAPDQIGYIYDSNGEIMIELAKVFRKPLQYNELGLAIEQATIAAEDKDFYEHDGIPVTCVHLPIIEQQTCWWAPLSLPWRWMGGKGGSTITMQLVRNHYLTALLRQERTSTLVTDNAFTRFVATYKGAPWVNRLTRKLREIKYALHLERELRDYTQRVIYAEMKDKGYWWPQRWIQSHLQAKRRAKEILLARYVSTTYYGYSMFGPDSASRFYFNRPVKDLKAHEAALMASFAPAPSVYGQIRDVRRVRIEQKNRRDMILERMGSKQFLTTSLDCGNPATTWDSIRWFFRAQLARGDCRDDVAFYQSMPVVLTGYLPGGRTSAAASVQTALDELGTRGYSRHKLFDGMIRLHTTVDMRVQRIVNSSAQASLLQYHEQYPAAKDLPQIAIVVLRNSDGAILGQFGGFTRDVPNSWTHLDRTRKSWRQPGSIFKIFVYLAALIDNRFTPDSSVNDGGPYPIRMGSGRMHYIHDYTPDYRGWIPFREAIAQSRNVPAMHVGIEYTNLDTIIRIAHEAGITSPLRNEASTILGASDITVMELANAFRTIASGGVVTTPYALRRVTNSFGEELDSFRATTTRLDVPSYAIEGMQELLRGAVRIPSGTARSMNALLPNVPLMCKTGTSNDFADARAACATYGIHGITVGVWMGRDDSNDGLGAGASGGKLALPAARYIFERLYRDDLITGKQPMTGPVPSFPEDMEARITAYIEQKYPKAPSKK